MATVPTSGLFLNRLTQGAAWDFHCRLLAQTRPTAPVTERITGFCQAYRLLDGQAGIAHLRKDGTCAFYPYFRVHRKPGLRHLNYVCDRDELVLGPWCDKEGRKVAA